MLSGIEEMVATTMESLVPKSKVHGGFQIEKMRDNECLVYYVDPDWRNASMAFAYILKNDDSSIPAWLKVELRATFFRYTVREQGR